MRLHEFADAEAQLALLRTIIDNTWSAIAQQAEQQRREEQQRKAQAKPKKTAKGSAKAISMPVPTSVPSPKFLPKPSQPTQSNPQGQPVVQSKLTPTATGLAAGMLAKQNPKVPVPSKANPSIDSRTRSNEKGHATDETDLVSHDRHSPKGIYSLKKLLHEKLG